MRPPERPPRLAMCRPVRRCGFQAVRTVQVLPRVRRGDGHPERPQPQRKIVTVLFCDLAGSTALGETLDPEQLRALLARYFERMQGNRRAHGGTVEKFIGDAVMAVFGVPTVHEDDALRAVRAALEMRDALPELGLEGRIGVKTGEVVTGTKERLATGDAVNVAARLEQAATSRRGADRVADPRTRSRAPSTSTPSSRSTSRARRGPFPPSAWCASATLPSDATTRLRRPPARARAAPIRWDHRAERAVRARHDGRRRRRRQVAACRRGARTIDARVVRGRCLPYGDGITYWPVVEVLKQLDLIPAEPRGRGGDPIPARPADAATSAEEIAWAFRKTLEQAAPSAARGPLRRHPVGRGDVPRPGRARRALSTGAPILLLCLARPELVELRPGWPVTLRLEPLAADEVEELSRTASPESCASGSRAPPEATPSSSGRWSRWRTRRRAR